MSRVKLVTQSELSEALLPVSKLVFFYAQVAFKARLGLLVVLTLPSSPD